MTAAVAAAALIAGSAWAAPGGAGRAPASPTGADAEVWTGMSAAQAVALIEETGATVTDQLEGQEGYSINYQYPSGLHAYLEGFDCVGQGLQAVCGEIETGAVFTADDPEHAARLEREMSFVWLADVANIEPGEVLVWRRDCLHGGVTRGQVRHLLLLLEEQLLAVADSVWPQDGTSRPEAPVET